MCVCQTFSRSQQREILMPCEVPQGPWEKIGADFFQFKSTNYLMITDYYSQFPIIRRMNNTTTIAPTDLMKQIFSEYGIPKMAKSDRRIQLSLKEFKAFASQYCFDHLTSNLRYPQEQWHDRMNGTDSEAVPEEIHGTRTWFLPSYINLQGNTTLKQPANPTIATEWKEIQAVLPTRSLMQYNHRHIVR